jgi:hypothetical protein
MTHFTDTKTAILEMMGLTLDSNIFTYALKLMRSLKEGTVTSDDYDRVLELLKARCTTIGLSTRCEELNLDLF